ncbi:hypothetical protein R1sor_020722 [Riccia sorocarpa]|uniref:Reverse transcriptase domain-containing protein n=1 Tax=Riccia sorocarpa TaxID=122646 RepID=A0ABD3GGG2_9MARC
MVRAFWSSNGMLERDVRGCIKLLPETEDRQYLKNWRLVTLVSYKKMGSPGMPLAPLLFALSTQPLMKAFQVAEENRELNGLQLPHFKAITTELFTEDTNIVTTAVAREFSKVKEIIGRFKLASGAELNMQKLLVLALGRAEVPTWVRSLGCEVGDRSKHFKFLGVWSWRVITDTEFADGVLRSIEKKIQMWANRYLSWKSRLVLIKHICAAIPQHHLMAVRLHEKGMQRINSSLNHFLWGWTEDGKPKTTLR